jgi:peroxiredoxin Q/BCP
MLAVGSQAPDFSATLDDGTTFSLARERGVHNVVLYFYPKDFTSGCTKEACAFRDNYAEIGRFDAIIVGVSADSAESHTDFRERHQLQFPLIADQDGTVRDLYQARKSFVPFMPPRITYVIDKEGVIRAAMRHDIQVTRHIDEVLGALRSFAPEAAAS